MNNVSPTPQLVSMPADFNADAYMDAFSVAAAPEEAFSHVSASLDSGIKEGMIVEMPVQDHNKTKDKFFWLAEILSVHGPLLRLRFVI